MEIAAVSQALDEPTARATRDLFYAVMYLQEDELYPPLPTTNQMLQLVGQAPDLGAQLVQAVVDATAAYGRVQEKVSHVMEDHSVILMLEANTAILHMSQQVARLFKLYAYADEVPDLYARERFTCTIQAVNNATTALTSLAFNDKRVTSQLSAAGAQSVVRALAAVLLTSVSSQLLMGTINVLWRLFKDMVLLETSNPVKMSFVAAVQASLEGTTYTVDNPPSFLRRLVFPVMREREITELLDVVDRTVDVSLVSQAIVPLKVALQYLPLPAVPIYEPSLLSQLWVQLNAIVHNIAARSIATTLSLAGVTPALTSNTVYAVVVLVLFARASFFSYVARSIVVNTIGTPGRVIRQIAAEAESSSDEEDDAVAAAPLHSFLGKESKRAVRQLAKQL